MLGFVQKTPHAYTDRVAICTPLYAPRRQNALFYIFTVFKTHYLTIRAANFAYYAFFCEEKEAAEKVEIVEK